MPKEAQKKYINGLKNIQGYCLIILKDYLLYLDIIRMFS